MTTSGTYNFNPSLGELTLYAFNMAGLRNTSLLQEHMQTARMATNAMLSAWANKGVNLWTVDLVTDALIAGQATYTVDPSTVMVLDAYMRIDDGVNDPIDRIILPVSRTEYASYPNKDQQGFSTTFWFDRLTSPTITLWPVPDGTSAQYLKYYRTRQIQDANLSNGQQVEIPYRWIEAFADGLAYRLAKVWAPEKAMALKSVADESYDVAAYQDVEQAQQYISPQIIGYYRP
jgi:hypothetical protein